MEQISVDGLDVAFQRAGSGQPIVLLHGALGDSRDWQPQIDGLSDEFTVIAWDAPGCGASSDPPESYGVEGYVRCLAMLMEQLSLPDAHLLGLSWGGSLALEVYRRHPDAVRSLLLADTYAGWRGSLPEDVVEERLRSSLHQSEMPPEEVVGQWLPGLVTEQAPQSLRNALARTMSEFHPSGFRAMILAMADVDARDLLRRVHVPTLLLWGEEDERSPLTVAEEFRRAIPAAELRVIPGAGHMSNFEQPELFNAAVREFCRKVDPGRSGAPR